MLNEKHLSTDVPKSCKLSVFFEFDSKQEIVSFVFQQNTMNIELKHQKTLEKSQTKKQQKRKEQLKRPRKQQGM